MSSQEEKHVKHDKDGYPVVQCFRQGVHLVIPKCPFCGRRHLHGGGDTWADDGGDDGGGHRVAHCDPGTPGAEKGYILAVVGELPCRVCR